MSGLHRRAWFVLPAVSIEIFNLGVD